MKPSGGCNMMKALKRALSIPKLDSILLIMGSVLVAYIFHLKNSKFKKNVCYFLPRPDQNMEILEDFFHQMILNKASPLHCVSYEINNHIVNVKIE